VRLRTLAALVLAALAMLGLAGCRTNVGIAATVNGHRITESEVNKYLTPSGTDASLAANARQQGQTVPSPRSQILQYLIQQQVFEHTLASFTKVPSAGELAGLHDQAASVLLQTDLAGDELDSRIRQGLPKSGISAKFTPVFLRVQELEYAIIQAKQLTRQAQLLALVKRAGVKVSVGARYGTWAPATLSVTAGAVTPSFLTVQSGSAAAQVLPGQATS
jgi:hypothetical protein